ncbi:hypothetical protein V1477_019982 [Vespula maculifrons]|uniref:Uncharacterized protein n=1 Tax=Vespula maculifrons TaxID=7453 RepID=A0ABD2ALF7_VESMC
MTHTNNELPISLTRRSIRNSFLWKCLNILVCFFFNISINRSINYNIFIYAQNIFFVVDSCSKFVIVYDAILFQPIR